MRRGLLIFILVNLLILTLLVRSVSTLLSLLVEDAAADAIHRAELPSPNSSLIETRPQIIPKIIHQTYKNETIPEVWREAQQSCIDLHPDYEYIVRGHPTISHMGTSTLRLTREIRVANSRAAVD
jgi:mannosyltransferase OCH1-like enzyme